MLFSLICHDIENGFELRKQTRPAHLAFLAEHDVRFAGPMLSDDESSAHWLHCGYRLRELNAQRKRLLQLTHTTSRAVPNRRRQSLQTSNSGGIFMKTAIVSGVGP